MFASQVFVTIANVLLSLFVCQDSNVVTTANTNAIGESSLMNHGCTIDRVVSAGCSSMTRVTSLPSTSYHCVMVVTRHYAILHQHMHTAIMAGVTRILREIDDSPYRIPMLDFA